MMRRIFGRTAPKLHAITLLYRSTRISFFIGSLEFADGAEDDDRARVDEAETHVPGPTYDGPGRAERPWSSSLAAESPQAGVANEADMTSDPLEERPQDDERD